MENKEPLECKSEAGITVGLIDTIITTANVLGNRDLWGDGVAGALEDLQQSDNMKRLMNIGRLEDAKDYIAHQRKEIEMLCNVIQLLTDRIPSKVPKPPLPIQESVQETGEERHIQERIWTAAFDHSTRFGAADELSHIRQASFVDGAKWCLEVLRPVIFHHEKEANSLKQQVAIYEQDLSDAAGELLVEIAEPGTDVAKLIYANRILKYQIDDQREEISDLKRQLSTAATPTSSIAGVQEGEDPWHPNREYIMGYMNNDATQDQWRERYRLVVVGSETVIRQKEKRIEELERELSSALQSFKDIAEERDEWRGECEHLSRVIMGTPSVNAAKGTSFLDRVHNLSLKYPPKTTTGKP